MLKDKGTVIDEMRGLISHLNCSDSHCEVCAFRSHCCMCVRALEVLYDNGYRKISKDSVIFTREKWEDLHKKIFDNLHYAREQARKQAAAEIFLKMFEESIGYFDEVENKVYMILSVDILLSLFDLFGFTYKEKYEK